MNKMVIAHRAQWVLTFLFGALVLAVAFVPAATAEEAEGITAPSQSSETAAVSDGAATVGKDDSVTADQSDIETPSSDEDAITTPDNTSDTMEDPVTDDALTKDETGEQGDDVDGAEDQTTPEVFLPSDTDSTPVDDASQVAGYEEANPVVVDKLAVLEKPSVQFQSSAQKQPAASTQSVAAQAAAPSTPKAAATQAATTSKLPAGFVTAQVLADKAVYQIVSVASGKVLDISNGSKANFANVQQYAANSTLAQYFQVRWLGDGWYRFISLISGKVLDIAEGSTASGANVQQYAWNGTDAQKWGLTKNSDGTYSMVCKAALANRLDISDASKANGANVQMYQANNSVAQKYTFKRDVNLTKAATLSTLKPIANGLYSLKNQNSGKMIDVLYASTANGANVQQYASNGTFAQKLNVVYVGYGLYRFAFLNSNKVLDVSSASLADCANVQQFQNNGTKAQLWYLVPNGKCYAIISANSGKVLDISYGSKNNNANVQQFSANGTPAQSFTFIPVPIVNNGTYVIQSAIMEPMVLDVFDGSKSNYANVQSCRSNGTNAQKWIITYLGNNQYSLKNVGSGKYLDVSNASNANNANIQQFEWNNTNAQKWVISYTNGSFAFKSVASGKMLDIYQGSRFSGANVQQYASNGTNAQKYNLLDGSWSFYAGASNEAMQMIQTAEQYEGWRYVWGGRSPSVGFDCAGLVEWCANSTYGMGIDMMYTNASSLFYNYCYQISASEARAGDVVFYRGTYGSDINMISHVVIYCGNGIMYGAGDPIGYQPVDCITNIWGNRATPIYARLRV